MAAEHADQLLDSLIAAPSWPPPAQRTVWDRVRLHRAFRQSDEALLKSVSNHAGRGDEYVTDPLPALISNAFADLLYGEDPEITAATESDQARLDEITARMPSELRRAVRISSSEGEVWWRVYLDRAASMVPVIQWVSRGCVIPMFRADRLLAAAFVTSFPQAESRVLRHVEVQTDGETRHLLFDGTTEQLGRQVNLDRLADVADLPEEWVHGLPMLCGRIVNTIDEDPTCGRSDYQGVERMFLALNEANTIAMKNARLTARKRIFADSSVLNERGEFRVHDDVIITQAEGGEVGAPGGTAPPVTAVELSFDAEALILHINALTDQILSRVGVSPQLVGRNVAAVGPESGKALAMRMMQSVLAAQGKARYWDDDLPHVLELVQRVDALPVEQDGMGYAWSSPSVAPIIERSSVLPEDEASEVDRHAVAVAAEIESRRTAITMLHEDWTDEQVTEELAQIVREQSAGPLLDVPLDLSSPPIAA